MFTIEGFIESCRKTIVASNAERVICELVTEVIHDPWTVIFAMPERLDAGFDARHRSAELTILRRNACRFSRSVGEPTKNVN